MSGYADHTYDEWRSTRPQQQKELVDSCRLWLTQIWNRFSPYSEKIDTEELMHLCDVVPTNILRRALNISRYSTHFRKKPSVKDTIPEGHSEDDYQSFFSQLITSRSPHIALQVIAFFEDDIDWQNDTILFLFQYNKLFNENQNKPPTCIQHVQHVRHGHWLTEAIHSDWPSTYVVELIDLAQTNGWKWHNLEKIHPYAWPWLFFLNATNTSNDALYPRPRKTASSAANYRFSHNPCILLAAIESHLPHRLNMRWPRHADSQWPNNRFSNLCSQSSLALITLEYTSKESALREEQKRGLEFILNRWTTLVTPQENDYLLQTLPSLLKPKSAAQSPDPFWFQVMDVIEHHALLSHQPSLQKKVARNVL